MRAEETGAIGESRAMIGLLSRFNCTSSNGSGRHSREARSSLPSFYTVSIFANSLPVKWLFGETDCAATATQNYFPPPEKSCLRMRRLEEIALQPANRLLYSEGDTPRCRMKAR